MLCCNRIFNNGVTTRYHITIFSLRVITMKATGIIRRIDDLGRVVIPKEIRRTLRIREGDPLEIYVEDGAVIYKKYYPMDCIVSLATQYSEVLNKITTHPILITDKDRVIAVSGVSKREYLERRISNWLEEVIESRRPYQFESERHIYPIDGVTRIASIIYPIISNGELYGSVILLADDRLTIPTEVELKLIQSVAAFLSRHLADE